MSDRSLLVSAGIVLLILLAVLAGGLVYGRNAATLPANQQTGITVTGYSETKAVPDIAYVDFSIVTRDARSRPAVTQNAAIVGRVVAAIEKTGIKKSDINTQNYSLQPWTEWVKDTQKYRGYVVTNSIVVSVRDLARVSDVADAATAAGANRLSGVSFGIEDVEALRQSMLKAAVKDARRKAEAVAANLGVKAGSPISVDEDISSRGDNDGPLYPASPSLRRANLAASRPTYISPGQMDISKDVVVTFAIEP